MRPDHEIPRGNVVLIADGDDAPVLERWIASAGERPVVVSGAERLLLENGDDEAVDLVVTSLDPAHPASRIIVERLAHGELFRGVPRLHVVRDGSAAGTVDPARGVSDAQALIHPPSRDDLQSRVRLGAEIGRLRKEAARSSIRDAMTGLFNRRYLMFRLEEEFSRARRYRTPVSLLVMDVDHLKRINDAAGQSAGDAVLRRLGAVARELVRKEDVLGRFGDDAFAVVLPGNRFRGAAVLAHKIRSAIEETPFGTESEPREVRVSVGVSTYPDNPSVASADDLLRRAEDALAEAKARGGNRVFIDEGVLERERRVVLMVDADPDLIDVAEDLLGLDDFVVRRASSTEEAFAALAVVRPDLVIVDLAEAGEDGTLLASIRETGARIPVIGLSRDVEADPDAWGRLGVDRFVTKPFSASVLRSLARELLEGRPVAR